MASEAKGWGLAALIGVALIAAQAAAELAMGRPAICTCGTVLPWYGDLFGPGLSQHIADWYSFTHISHGFVFYAFTRIAAPRAPLWTRLAATLVLEVSWEVVENTPLIIDRYRQSALAQGYNGDSVVNSVSDTLFCVLGFWLAWRLPVRLSLAFVVVNEIALAALIHDNLALNVLQLVHPTDAVSKWQASGGLVGGDDRARGDADPPRLELFFTPVLASADAGRRLLAIHRLPPMVADSSKIPARRRRLRLMAGPQPGDLEHRRAQPRIARLRHALLVGDRPAPPPA